MDDVEKLNDLLMKGKILGYSIEKDGSIIIMAKFPLEIKLNNHNVKIIKVSGDIRALGE